MANKVVYKREAYLYIVHYYADKTDVNFLKSAYSNIFVIVCHSQYHLIYLWQQWTGRGFSQSFNIIKRSQQHCPDNFVTDLFIQLAVNKQKINLQVL